MVVSSLWLFLVSKIIYHNVPRYSIDLHLNEYNVTIEHIVCTNNYFRLVIHNSYILLNEKWPSHTLLRFNTNLHTRMRAMR